MRWLADENIPGYAIAYLRGRGEDVLSIAETTPAVSDIEVLALARREQRLLISFDRDHGDLVFNRGFAPPRGIVFLRFSPPTPEVVSTVFPAHAGMNQSCAGRVLLHGDNACEVTTCFLREGVTGWGRDCPE